MVKRWLICIAVLIITAFLSVAYLETAPTMLLSMELMTLVLSFLYVIFATPGVVVIPVVDDETRTVGEKLELRARVKNISALPVFYGEMEVWFKYKQDGEIVSVLIPFSSIPGRPQEMSLSFGMKCSGSLSISYKSVYVYDFLRLFKIKKGIKAKTGTVDVVPELQKLLISDKSSAYLTPMAYEHAADEDDLSSHVQQFYKDRVGDDPSEVFDTHSYRVGDSLSKVNWKLSARTGTLMVKDYSAPIIQKTVVLVDLSCKSQREFHLRVHTAMAICFSMLEMEIYAALAWADAKENICQMRRFEKDADLSMCMGELIRADISEKVSPADLVGDMKLSCQLEQLIYITSKPSDEELAHLMLIDESKRIYVFDIGDGEMSADKLTDKITVYRLPGEHLEDALSQTMIELY